MLPKGRDANQRFLVVAGLVLTGLIALALLSFNKVSNTAEVVVALVLTPVVARLAGWGMGDQERRGDAQFTIAKASGEPVDLIQLASLASFFSQLCDFMAAQALHASRGSTNHEDNSERNLQHQPDNVGTRTHSNHRTKIGDLESRFYGLVQRIRELQQQIRDLGYDPFTLSDETTQLIAEQTNSSVRELVGKTGQYETNVILRRVNERLDYETANLRRIRAGRAHRTISHRVAGFGPWPPRKKAVIGAATFLVLAVAIIAIGGGIGSSRAITQNSHSKASPSHPKASPNPTDIVQSILDSMFPTPTDTGFGQTPTDTTLPTPTDAGTGTQQP